MQHKSLVLLLGLLIATHAYKYPGKLPQKAQEVHNLRAQIYAKKPEAPKPQPIVKKPVQAEEAVQVAGTLPNPCDPHFVQAPIFPGSIPAAGFVPYTELRERPTHMVYPYYEASCGPHSSTSEAPCTPPTNKKQNKNPYKVPAKARLNNFANALQLKNMEEKSPKECAAGKPRYAIKPALSGTPSPSILLRNGKPILANNHALPEHNDKRRLDLQREKTPNTWVIPTRSKPSGKPAKPSCRPRSESSTTRCPKPKPSSRSSTNCAEQVGFIRCPGGVGCLQCNDCEPICIRETCDSSSISVFPWSSTSQCTEATVCHYVPRVYSRHSRSSSCSSSSTTSCQPCMRGRTQRRRS